MYKKLLENLYNIDLRNMVDTLGIKEGKINYKHGGLNGLRDDLVKI